MCTFILKLCILTYSILNIRTRILTVYVYSIYVYIVYTRGEGGLRPPSPLVWVAGATLISSEEVV